MKQEQQYLVPWTCDWMGPRPGGSRELEQWTVGDVFQLSCRGEPIGRPLKADAQFVFPQRDQAYSLHILEVIESESTYARFWVTGYRPGAHQSSELKLVDSSGQAVAVEPLEWEIHSVIAQQEEASPYPPYGPYLLSTPWSYWASWVLALVAFLALFGWRWRRWSQRRFWRAELQSQGRAQTPYVLFHRELRALRRRLEQGLVQDVGLLREAFLLYLARSLLVPAHRQSFRQTLRELKSQRPKLYRALHPALQSLDKELKKAQDLDVLQRQDFAQLLEISGRLVDQLEEGFKDK